MIIKNQCLGLWAKGCSGFNACSSSMFWGFMRSSAKNYSSINPAKQNDYPKSVFRIMSQWLLRFDVFNFHAFQFHWLLRLQSSKAKMIMQKSVFRIMSQSLLRFDVFNFHAFQCQRLLRLQWLLQFDVFNFHAFHCQRLFQHQSKKAKMIIQKSVFRIVSQWLLRLQWLLQFDVFGFHAFHCHWLLQHQSSKAKMIMQN